MEIAEQVSCFITSSMSGVNAMTYINALSDVDYDRL